MTGVEGGTTHETPSGSPPVGPLQALRPLIDAYRDAIDKRASGRGDWPTQETIREKLDAALVSVEEQLAALTRALAVFGIEPPENPGEEWTRITENGPEPAGDTAVEAAEAEAQNVTRLYDKANAQLAALQAENRRLTRLDAIAQEIEATLQAMRARGSSPSSPKGDA